MEMNKYDLKFKNLNKRYNYLKEQEKKIQLEEFKVGSQLHQCFSQWLKEKLN